MKKNYIEPSMMVVTLNANTILAGSLTIDTEKSVGEGGQYGKEMADYRFDLVDVEE